MKKILVTGALFTGAVVVLYGEPGMGADAEPPILSVDMSAALLSDIQKRYILGCVPLRYGAGYEQNWDVMTGKVIIITEDHEVEFEPDFWKPYNKKINKERCLPEWKKMSRADRALAVFKLGAYDRYLMRTGIAKADPENYLKKKYYKNDYDNL